MTKTIIIAVHNPEDLLISYVEELLSACVPHVIVVDDGSDLLYQPAFASLERLPGCTVIHTDRGMEADQALAEGISYYETYLRPLADSQLLAVNFDSIKDRENMLAYVEGYDHRPFRIALRNALPDQLGKAFLAPFREAYELGRVFIMGGLRAVSRY